jgi:hypothetical protein
MTINRFFVLLSLGLMAASAHAQPVDVCAVALREKAYDVTRSDSRASIVMAAKDNICSRDYRDEGEAKASARSAGFDLSYAGFGVGGNSGKATSNNRWSLSETNFCKATARELQAAYSDQYETQIANIAVGAWLDCVKNSRENQLFLQYNTANDGSRFTGQLITTAQTGTLERTITGVVLSGAAKDTVICNVGGREFKPSQTFSAIEVRTTGTNVACEKSGPEGVDIGFQTSAGSVSFVKLPSDREIKISETRTLIEKIDALRNEFTSLNADVQNRLNPSAVSGLIDQKVRMPLEFFTIFYDVPLPQQNGVEAVISSGVPVYRRRIMPIGEGVCALTQVGFEHAPMGAVKTHATIDNRDGFWTLQAYTGVGRPPAGFVGATCWRWR